MRTMTPPSPGGATSPADGGGRRSVLAEWQLALPLALAFASIFLAPLLMLVGVSFFNDDKISQPGFGQWAKFLGDPFSYKVIADTMLLGVKTVGATILIGYPLALVYLDASPRVQKVLIFVIVMPLLLSVVVRTFAWIVVLGPRRRGQYRADAAWSHLRAPASPADRARPRDFPDPDRDAADAVAADQRDVAARSQPARRFAALGASRWRTLFTVIVPLSMPGLVAGCLLVFASSTTAFISQSVIGGVRLIYLPLLIWQQSLVVFNWPFAAVVSIALLISVLTVVSALSWLGRRSGGYVHG